MDEIMALVPHILLVDDDDDTRDELGELFRAQGWTVDEACDGEQAMTKLDARGYDLVVTDFWLREFNGGEIVAYMHAIGNAPPVLMMSAVPQGLALPGACLVDGYLRKPFSLEQMLEVATKLLEKRRRSPRESPGSGTFAFGDRGAKTAKGGT
jgi:DNA-binding response OmpR family regulator